MFQTNINMANNILENNIPWVEKYRPEDFSEIISHKEIISVLLKLISNNKMMHMIFYGPPGTGKTTTILACAKQIYGPNFRSMILELNGSDDRGINVVREQVKEFSATDSKICKIFDNHQGTNTKLVILDEADAMTYDAQFALRRLIETYTESTRFCLICNYSTKIIPALKSRCQTFIFGPISNADHMIKINQIIKAESIQIDSDAIEKIVELSDGDMRRSLNLLQPLHTINEKSGNSININSVYKLIGYPTDNIRDEIIKCFMLKNLNTTYYKLNQIMLENNLSNYDIIREMTNYFGRTYLDNYQTKLLATNTKNKNRFKLVDQNKLINLFDKLSNVEINLATNTNNNVHLLAICSIIVIFNSD